MLYNCGMIAIAQYEALKQMRKLSDDNIPFSFSFLSCNLTTQQSDGFKEVSKAKLRVGLSSELGIKSRSLIGYFDLETNENRWFYLPLLTSFNQYTIKCSK